jgi:hypothetical protein
LIPSLCTITIIPALGSNIETQEDDPFLKNALGWQEFFNYVLDLAALNIVYVAKHHKDELFASLEPCVVSEIIERAVKYYNTDVHFDNTLMLELLMELRGCPNVF